MAELDDFEQRTAGQMVERFVAQGMDRERAARAARALVLQASALGELNAIEAEGEDDDV